MSYLLYEAKFLVSVGICLSPFLFPHSPGCPRVGVESYNLSSENVFISSLPSQSWATLLLLLLIFMLLLFSTPFVKHLCSLPPCSFTVSFYLQCFRSLTHDLVLFFNSPTAEKGIRQNKTKIYFLCF